MNSRNQKPSFGIRPPLEAFFVALVVFVAAMAGISFLALEAISVQKKTVREDLLRMANAAAGLVDGDLHGKLISPSQAGGEDYARALAPLVKFHRGVPEIAYLYTLIEKDGKFHFVLDTATAAKSLGFDREMKASELMEPYESNSAEEDRAEMDALRRGTNYVSKETFQDEFGTFLTALAPIKSSDGRTVGVVGLDLNAADYVHRLAHLEQSILFSSFLVLMISLIVGFLVYRIRSRLKAQEIAGRLTNAQKEALEEQDRRLVSALGQIVYHYDVRTKRLQWRGECAAILGYPPGEMPGSPEAWKKRIHPKDNDLLPEWTMGREGKETSLIREYRCLHKEGHPVWVLDRAVLTGDDTGRLVAVDGVLLDISKQKKVETDLMAARDAAESAGRAKSDFLAVMSHEIRTPMNGVIGCTNLLLEMPVTPEQREYLTTIRKCGDSLLHLINDILDFSKMESDKLILEARAYSLRTCAEEVLDLYGLMAAEKKIELLVRFENPDLDWINGDEVRFRQILVNLIGNALKFTASGEVVVTLNRQPWLPGGEALMLSVKDTGIGIPQNKQQGIFLPFNQADSSTTRRFGGTGLGLAICGRLATLMGGAITVHSEEDKGAEFVVMMPLVEIPERNVLYYPEELRGKSVLLLDDNYTFRVMMLELLEPLGMRVSLAADIGGLKQSWVSGGVSDVLLVDTGLPVGVLGEIAQMLLSLPDAHRPKVVEIATPTLAARENIQGLECQGSLTKPIRRGALLQCLSGLFQAKQAPPVPAAPLPIDGSMAERFPMKILVVEDNAINRKVVLQMLKRLGYTPEVAENGKLCLERLESQSFDMILMDIQMPEMDGYEATAELRRRGDATWITALTADAMPEDPLRCRIAGMNDYLSKPIRSETLHAALERCAISRKALRV
ncbi:MAG: response regulator [Terrimicrobiaceae bacterium]